MSGWLITCTQNQLLQPVPFLAHWFPILLNRQCGRAAFVAFWVLVLLGASLSMSMLCRVVTNASLVPPCYWCLWWPSTAPVLTIPLKWEGSLPAIQRNVLLPAYHLLLVMSSDSELTDRRTFLFYVDKAKW